MRSVSAGSATAAVTIRLWAPLIGPANPSRRACVRREFVHRQNATPSTGLSSTSNSGRQLVRAQNANRRDHRPGSQRAQSGNHETNRLRPRFESWPARAEREVAKIQNGSHGACRLNSVSAIKKIIIARRILNDISMSISVVACSTPLLSGSSRVVPPLMWCVPLAGSAYLRRRDPSIDHEPPGFGLRSVCKIQRRGRRGARVYGRSFAQCACGSESGDRAHEAAPAEAGG